MIDGQDSGCEGLRGLLWLWLQRVWLIGLRIVRQRLQRFWQLWERFQRQWFQRVWYRIWLQRVRWQWQLGLWDRFRFQRLWVLWQRIGFQWFRFLWDRIGDRQRVWLGIWERVWLWVTRGLCLAVEWDSVESDLQDLPRGGL